MMPRVSVSGELSEVPSRVMVYLASAGQEEVRGDVVGPVLVGDHLVDVGAGDLVDQVAVDVAQPAPGVVGDEDGGVLGAAAQEGDLLGVVSRFGGPLGRFLGAERARLGAQPG